MIVFLQSLGSRVAKAVTKLFYVPDGDEDTCSEIATKKFDANTKVHYALLQALNDDIAKVIHCKSTTRFGQTLLSKSRELRLLSYVLNMKNFL